MSVMTRVRILGEVSHFLNFKFTCFFGVKHTHIKPQTIQIRLNDSFA